MNTIQVKRVYEALKPEDGARFLVDRVWPRGIKRETLEPCQWLKEVAPSNELRRWFGHDPRKWETFRERYWRELRERPDAYAPIIEAAERGAVTFLYAARDAEHNNAIALRQFLTGRDVSPTRRKAVPKRIRK
jgi:uncharacterized protein YeaO (DUF488 family)